MGPSFRDHKILHKKSQRGNLYCVMCAETGVGKDDMLDVVRLCAEVGDEQHLLEDVRSWPGIHAKMLRMSRHAPYGARLMVAYDEYGQVLRALKNVADGPLQEFQRNMLSQFTRFHIPEAPLVDPNKVRGKVDKTYIPFFGGTQPEVWAEGLPDNAFASGGINRTLCFFVDGVPDERPFDAGDIDGDILPDDAVRALKWLWEVEARLSFGGTPEIRLSPSPEALEVLKSFHRECEDLRKLLTQKQDARKDGLLRGLQLTKRVALVLAAGEAAEDPSRLDDVFAPVFYIPLTETTAEYAVNIVRQCLRDMLRYASGNIGVTAEAKLAKRISQWMSKNGASHHAAKNGWFQLRDVRRCTLSGKERAYEWVAAWDRLLDTGVVVRAAVNEAPSKGAWYRVQRV